MKSVLITGGSGSIGGRLTKELQKLGYKVGWLSRNSSVSTGIKKYYWNPSKEELDTTALSGTDIIVNLAGAGIADKLWTNSRKIELYESRLLSLELLHSKLSSCNHSVKKIISASAIGYYGNRPNEILSENSEKGKGFLSDLCNDWENSADKFKELGIEVSKVRIGVVFNKNAGSFPLFKRLSRLPVLPYPLGGKQMVSWIHIYDMVRIIIHIIETENSVDVVNCVGPNPINTKSLIKTIAKKQSKRSIIGPVPAFPLKILAPDMSEIVLNSQHVLSDVLLKSDFKWKYPTLDKALNDLLY